MEGFLETGASRFEQVHTFAGFLDYLRGGGAALGTFLSVLAAIVAYLATALAAWVGAVTRRRIELLDAVKADIARTARDHETLYSAEEEQKLRDRFERARIEGRDHVPYSSAVTDDTIFDLITPELPSLPGDLIELIVEYYQTDKLICQLTLDLRTPSYLAMEIDRKMTFALYEFEMARERFKLGGEIVTLIADRRHDIRFRRTLAWALLAVAAAAAVALVAALFRTAAA